MFIEIPGSINFEKEGLKGKKVAVQSQSTQEIFLKRTYGKSVEIITYQNFQDVIEAVSQKKADTALIDSLSCYYYLLSDAGSCLEIVGDPVTTGDGASFIIVDKKQEALLLAINQALYDIRINGEYYKINRKYLEFNIY